MAALAPGAGQAGAAEISSVVRAPSAVVYTTGQVASAPSVAAVEPAISDKKALEILKNAFPDPDWSGEQDISLSPGQGPDNPAWTISMRRPSMYGGPASGFHARVDAVTGEILNFSLRGNIIGAGSEIISREKARAIAESLARKLQPERIGSMLLDSSQSAAQNYYRAANSLNLAYSFNWKRTAGGMPVDGNGINISVNALSGRVVEYSYNWQADLKLPAAKANISAKEASGELMDQTGMYLSYYVPDNQGNSEGTPRARLVYRLNTTSSMVDAENSQLIDYLGRPVESARQFDSIPEAPGDMNPPAPATERISPGSALEKAKSFFRELGYTEELEQSGGGSGSGPLGREEYWSYSPRGSSRGPSPSVMIEVFTGRVASFHGMEAYYERPAQEGSKTITRDEAMVIARNFIGRVEPQLSRHLVPGESYPWDDSATTYQLRFSRVVNGIVFPQDGISVTVGQDGKIVSYSCDWHRVIFPPAKASITADDAAAIWLEKAPLKLAYFFPRDQQGKTLPARLVYRPEYGGAESIDALTGEPLKWDGIPLDGLKAGGYDFTGSWAAQQLKLMAESGLLPPSESFSPGSPASRRDGLRLIIAAAGLNYNDDRRSGPAFSDVSAEDPDFTAIQRAAQLGFVEKGGQLLPGEPLDRKTLAAWLVSGLGYREVASIPSLIESPFKDISGLPLKDRNNIGLACGLGLLSGDGSGNFRPLDSVTWEELAAVIMKLPSRLNERLGRY